MTLPSQDAPAPSSKAPGIPLRAAPPGVSEPRRAAPRSAWKPRLAPWMGRDPDVGLASLRVLVALAAVAAVGTYLVLGIVHLRYPFELEWMEGAILDAVRRVLAGQKIYVKPTLDFVPYLYPPLYFDVFFLIVGGGVEGRRFYASAALGMLMISWLGRLQIAVTDVLAHGRVGDELRADIHRALAEKRFAAVVVDSDAFQREIEETYQRQGDVFKDADVFFPVTGWRVRPKAIYVPR